MKLKLLRWKSYLISTLATLAAVGLIVWFHDYVNLTTVSLTLLLVVLFIATIYGSRPAFLSAVIGLLGFNFLFIPPFYTFTISDEENWIAFAAFMVTALTAGQLSSYARRRAEESEQQRLEIERLYKELQTAFEQASQAEALKQSEKLKSSLLDAVTHDMRTPLTSIKASVTTLLEDAERKMVDDEGKREFLEIIDEETDRLNEFIEGMVTLAKIEANALSTRKNNHDIEEIINHAVQRAEHQLANHELIIETSKDLPKVFADAVSIAEVIYTLLDNAAKYSPKGSKIKISARQFDKEFIEITVADQGRGIAEHLREKVFSKFYRREDSDIHTTSSGLGLGLAIAKGIVESQGGTIHIKDGTDGFVTEFVFTIKISEDEE